MPNAATIPPPENEEFSLVLGGPLYQLYLRSHLLRPPLALVYRRIIAAIAITWLPLAVLTLSAGTFARGVSVPFIFDLANARFLIVLPILIGAELVVHRRIRLIVQQFIQRDMLAPDDVAKFDVFERRAMRLRNSASIEILLLIISYVGGYWVSRQYGTLHIDTWFAYYSNGAIQLTPAGYWLSFVSLPLMRFILLRWYFRLIIWYIFLWRVSRMHLRLNALHPDRAGGLGFLSNSIEALAPILFAQSIFVSVMMGNMILYGGAKLPEFKFLIGVAVLYLVLLVTLPMFFFVAQMVEAKLQGTRTYGALASRYVNDFRQKWLREQQDFGESELGSGDFQSLADLGNSFEVARTMRFVPFDKRALLRLVVVLLVPFLPLGLTMFSLEEILERLLKLVV